MKKAVLLLIGWFMCLDIYSAGKVSGSGYVLSQFVLVSTFCFIAFIILLCVYIMLMQYKELKSRNRKIVELTVRLNGLTQENSHHEDSKTGVHEQHMENVVTELKHHKSSHPVGDELFCKFDEHVRKEKLYLDYNLGRDDYSRLMGVDKNKFGNIIKEYGGGNISTYLNNLRLEYSVHLLSSCPHLSIQEIATRSAFPNTATYYRLFKEKYGKSPNSYRNEVG